MVRLRRALVVAVLLVGVAGCAADPVPAPEPEETQTVTPTAEPQPGPPSLLEITAEGFRVLDAEGAELAAHVIGDDPAPAVAVLTEAIGGAPTVTTYTLDTGCVGGTSYDWGEAISLFAYDPPRREDFPQTELWVRAAQAGSLSVQTDAGFGIGDDGRAVAAGLPADQVNITQNGAFVWDKTGDVDSGGGAPLAFGGAAFTDLDSGVITDLITPGTILSGYC
jgi:hypothetical protein